MSDLTTKKCKPCEGGVCPMPIRDAEDLLGQVKNWELADEGKEIRREFRFGNFHETMAFVNALAWVAHREDHHPDLEVSYSRVLVRFSTHAIGGLSENDFICAAKTDQLLD